MEGILLAEIYNEYEINGKKKSEIKRQKKKLKNLLHTNKALYEYWLLEMSIDEQKKTRKSDEDLYLMEQKLDEFYLVNKFRCLAEKVNRRDIVEDDFTESNEEEHTALIDWATHIKKRELKRYS